MPEEREIVIGALSGADLDRWGRPTDRPLDFYDGKGVVEALFEALRVTAEFTPDDEFGMMRGRTARLVVAGEPVGVLAELHPDTLDRFEIEQPVVLFEVDLPALLPHLGSRGAAQSVSRFPAVEQDLAVVVDADVAASRIQAILEGSPLVASARVFDVFKGERLGAGKKSIAFSIRYQAPDRTLTGEDANREQAKLLKRLEREFGATLRA
jgi:phenylalanyl-tRNA synthetase beta chain